MTSEHSSVVINNQNLETQSHPLPHKGFTTTIALHANRIKIIHDTDAFQNVILPKYKTWINQREQTIVPLDA